jgi:hypothetical protein
MLVLLLYVSIVIVCHRYCMLLVLYVIVIFYILYGESLYGDNVAFKMNEMARNEKIWTYNSSERAHNEKIWTYNKKILQQ